MQPHTYHNPFTTLIQSLPQPHRAHTHTHSHIFTFSHTHTHSFASLLFAQAISHFTHTHTHTHAHTHTHTHTHTHHFHLPSRFRLCNIFISLRAGTNAFAPSTPSEFPDCMQPHTYHIHSQRSSNLTDRTHSTHKHIYTLTHVLSFLRFLAICISNLSLHTHITSTYLQD